MTLYRAALVCAALTAGCSRDRGVRVYLDESYPEKLSDWRLFTTSGPHLTPNQNVIAYEVRTPLFSNYATKSRTLWMPPGTKASARPDGSIDFPVGTVFSKTFAYQDRMIETRLLIHRAKGWIGVPYVWNREQTEATLAVSGDFTTVRAAGKEIEYAVPNVNQCRSCHDQGGDTVPLGPTVRNLNTATLARLGIATPAAEPVTLESRARSYLDVNCASCHNPSGSAMAIPLDVSYGQTLPASFGVNQIATKPVVDDPGMRVIITPGHPERSILVHRMESLDPKVGMPTIGHSVVDQAGVELMSDWIRSMKRN